MKNRFKGLILASAGATALLGTPAAAVAADASSAPAKDATVEAITVTGSLIAREGFVSPTPVTTVTTEDLQIAGYIDIGQALYDLPLAKATFSPKTTSQGVTFQGVNQPDLRGLGPVRTLVLVDGQRPVVGSLNGVDVNAIPISLVKRMDVVTGGASAAYGADAVSGVVNIVLNNDFVGGRANAQWGQTGDGYGQKTMASIAYGLKFGPDDRGHFMAAAQWSHDDEIFASDVPRLLNGTLQNPNFTSTNGQSQFLLVPALRYATTSLGGVIIGGPLNGITFGPGGAPRPFQVGTPSNATMMSGGDPDSIAYNYKQAISPADHHWNAYSRVSYDVSDSLKLHADFLYIDDRSDTTFQTNNNNIIGAFTITNTNAFLPASIAAQMATAGITSFKLGRANSDFGGNEGTVNDQVHTKAYWISIGADGSLGGGWRWKAFYNHGQNNADITTGPQQITALLQESINSTIVNGQAVCASTALKNPITGATCVPVNLFGFGAPSAAALAFFNADGTGTQRIRQDQVAATVQGNVFSTWAGPVSVALGAEWRRMSLNFHGDALEMAGAFDRLNLSTIIGKGTTSEVYGEAIVPLLKDVALAQSLEFTGAVRRSHYSTSGSVTSWKVGLTDRVTPELLLRGTYSRDNRQPTLTDLFSTQATNFGTVNDPTHGNVTNSIKILQGGNPHLRPELADTVTYGAVYSPSWAPKLNVSIDWYSIDMRDVLAGESAQTLVNYCAQGLANTCDQIIRDGSGTITQVNSFTINFARLKTSGVDLAAVHQFDLNEMWAGAPGSLSSNLEVTYVSKMIGQDGVNTNKGLANFAGLNNAPAMLRWRGALTETYQNGRFNAYARLRYMSGGAYTHSVTLDINHTGPAYFLDIGAAYALTPDKNYQVYANVTNVLDRQPAFYANRVSAWQDLFGVTYNVGVRARF